MENLIYKLSTFPEHRLEAIDGHINIIEKKFVLTSMHNTFNQFPTVIIKTSIVLIYINIK